MIEVARELFVGDQTAYDDLKAFVGLEGWAIVHACKEPYHREMLGYTGRAAPKDSPEYLFGFRGNRLILNLVDVDDPKYVSPELVDAAMHFITENLRSGRKVLVHCNQGRSRSPTIAMLYLAPTFNVHFERAEREFSGAYPNYLPAPGMRGFAKENWERYRLPLAA